MHNLPHTCVQRFGISLAPLLFVYGTVSSAFFKCNFSYAASIYIHIVQSLLVLLRHLLRFPHVCLASVKPRFSVGFSCPLNIRTHSSIILRASISMNSISVRYNWFWNLMCSRFTMVSPVSYRFTWVCPTFLSSIIKYPFNGFHLLSPTHTIPLEFPLTRFVRIRYIMYVLHLRFLFHRYSFSQLVEFAFLHIGSHAIFFVSCSCTGFSWAFASLRYNHPMCICVATYTHAFYS